MSGDRVVAALTPWLVQEFKLARRGVPNTLPATDAQTSKQWGSFQEKTDGFKSLRLSIR